MFFDEIRQIPEIAKKSGTTIVVMPNEIELNIPGALILKPEKKATITIDQVRSMLETLTTKQSNPRFVIIRPAEALTEEAANAILKNLEEPGENIHFLLVTEEPTRLLETILSRAMVYVWRGGLKKMDDIVADEKVKLLAKRLLIAKEADLVALSEELTKKKDGVREYVLKVLAITIEMAYKSYFLTGKRPFLLKIPKLLKAYDSIYQNGHIKLHLVADLI